MCDINEGQLSNIENRLAKLTNDFEAHAVRGRDKSANIPPNLSVNQKRLKAIEERLIHLEDIVRYSDTFNVFKPW